jgi:hypothetical protein
VQKAVSCCPTPLPASKPADLFSFRLGPERAQARARAGLVFGLSPDPEPAPQARPAKAWDRSVKPKPNPSPHFLGPLRPYFRFGQLWRPCFLWVWAMSAVALPHCRSSQEKYAFLISRSMISITSVHTCYKQMHYEIKIALLPRTCSTWKVTWLGKNIPPRQGSFRWFFSTATPCGIRSHGPLAPFDPKMLEIVDFYKKKFITQCIIYTYWFSKSCNIQTCNNHHF